jgi:hypothetical protein
MRTRVSRSQLSRESGIMVQAPYWIGKTWLYGFVGTYGLFGNGIQGQGYWYWIHTIGGEAIDGTLYECQSVPSIPTPIITGDSLNKISSGPVI